MIPACTEEFSDRRQVALGLVSARQVYPCGVDESLPEQVERSVARTLENDQPDVPHSRKFLGYQTHGRIAAGDDERLRWTSPGVIMEGTILEHAIVRQQTEGRNLDGISTCFPIDFGP
jgi:hypothetical protein